MQETIEIEEIITKFFSGIITPEKEVLLAAWLNESTENKKYFAQLKNIWEVAQPAFNPEEINLTKAEENVMRKISNRRWTQTPVVIWWQRVAAIMILPVIIMMSYLLYNQTPQKPVVAYQEVISPFGTSSKVDLPDGSTVWLNSGSKLKYPVVFASNERNVYLSGEGFFKVHADKSYPFIVATENVKVRATGTEFNVEAYSTDTITAVTLMEGKVDLNIFGDKTKKLQPNQRMVFNSISKTYSLTGTDARIWGLWKDGVLVFRDESLENVFKKIGRTYNVNIKLNDPVVAKQLYRATFEGESLEEILGLLKMTAPIKYIRTGRQKQSDNVYNKEQIYVLRAN
jgi:transmembrane sensor